MCRGCEFDCSSSALVGAVHFVVDSRAKSPAIEPLVASLQKLYQKQCDAVVVLTRWDNSHELPALRRWNIVKAVELRYLRGLWNMGVWHLLRCAKVCLNPPRLTDQ